MLNNFMIYILCLEKIALQFTCYLVPLFVIMALVTKVTGSKCWVNKLINIIVNMEV